MKLRNKLIPLASCLAIGATVAPMVTACGTSEFVDLTDGFTPTISKLAVEGNKLTAEKANQVYFNAVSENPEIFAQDYHWTASIGLRTAAENPENILGDTGGEVQTSVLNYAKQSIKNVKVGKTILYDQKSEEDVEYPTLSFDLTREQQFTWKHNESVATSIPAVQVTSVGTTMFTMQVKNIPMRLASYKIANSDSQTDWSYNPHFGRGLNSISGLIQYFPTNWFLVVDENVIEDMVDPWEVTYEYKIADTHSYVYNDVTHSYAQNASYAGVYNDVEKIASGDVVVQELLATTIACHYLGDIEKE